jgi:phosphate starvation-inducible protein PhoH and related proteins
MSKEKTIQIKNTELASLISHDEKLFHLLENSFESKIVQRGNSIIIDGEGEESEIIEKVFSELEYVFEKNGDLKKSDINEAIEIILDENNLKDNLSENKIKSTIIYHGYKDKIIVKNPNQELYYKSILENDLVFATGPAGTGKTFLAVAMALDALKKGEIGRIILTRPAVEAGESLGFLPGDMKEKIDPYLRPLTDALQFMVSADRLKSLRERNIIEINPLAYMRGRTLNNAFIILDEAQNTTRPQMKMFLTRLGRKSKAIITGDTTQIDLPRSVKSGLIQAEKILRNINGIAFVGFNSSDVQRHDLVSKIINAYEKENILISKERSE